MADDGMLATAAQPEPPPGAGGGADGTIGGARFSALALIDASPPPPPPLAATQSTQSDAWRRDAGAGVWSSALSLSLTTMGAGVLSFPYAAAQTGLLPLLALVVALGALSAYCSLINAEMAWRLRARARARTFDELAALALGRAAYAPAAAQVLLGLAGTLVGFLCVAGDLGTPVLGARLGGRAGVVLLFAAAVVLPLSGCARIHSLRGSSLLGVAAVVAVVALLVSRGAADAAGVPPLALASPRGLALALPIIIYGWGNQVVGVNIFHDAAPSVQRRWHAPVALACALIAALYGAAAIGGALAFGAAARGDVLLNFAADDAAAAAIKIVMALHVSLVIPVDIVPLRRSLAQALRRLCPPPARSRGGGGGEAAERGGEAPLLQLPGEDAAPAQENAAEAADAAADEAEAALPRVCGTPCSATAAAQTAAIVLAAAAAAIFLPQLNVVFGLLGATFGITCFSGYPALFLLARAREVEAAAAKQGSDGGGAQGEEGEEGEEEVAAAAPRYMPRSAAWLRCQGWAMLALSAVMAVLGTGVCIFSTWFS